MEVNGDYTKIPNGFIENMADLTGAEIALFLVICRQTIGWQKDFDRVPYSLIKEMSGYHPQAVKNAALNLIKKKWITRQGDRMTGYFYAPIVKITSHSSDNHHSLECKSPQTPDDNHHTTVVKSTTSKERKEKKETYTSEFETFWEGYPINDNKKGAFRGWQKVLKEGATSEQIIGARDAYIKEAKKKNREFMYASTFFGRDERWKEYQPEAPKPRYRFAGMAQIDIERIRKEEADAKRIEDAQSAADC